jgi:uncharacterized protein (TIGR01244 family)
MKCSSVFLSLLLGLVSTGAIPAEESIPVELPNLRQPQENRIAGGAIDATDLGRLRAAGIKHVINLRTAEESKGFEEGPIATGLGIDYHSIPIAGAQSLTKENARKLDELLKAAGDEPTLVHCGSGNRVGALIAIREGWIYGKPVEAAVAEGKRWGLTSLEGAVRSALAEHSKPESD